MKVLYFHQHFSSPKGSGTIRSYQAARHMLARGHTVTVVCGQSWKADTGLTGGFRKGMRRGYVDGIEVIELELPYSQHDGFLKRSWTFLLFAMRSVRIALREDFDLAFATSTPLTAGIPGIFARIFRRKPFVFEVRDLWPELPRAMGVIRNPLILGAMSVLEWMSYRAATGCIGLSPGIVEGIRKRSRADLPVAMIPNGSDLDLFRPAEDRGGLGIDGVADGDFVAVFCGTHGVANGLDAVVGAAEVLAKQGRDEIKLVLIGDGNQKARLQDRVARLSLRNVLFLDPMPKVHLAEILGRFDAGLQILSNVPAFYYGTSPNKFFDYLAAGLPVVTNYPGWIANLVAEHKCGLAVKPDEPEAFANALLRLANERELCGRFSRNARTLAETRFSRDVLMSQWLEFVAAQESAARREN